jgi:predicted membrane metal-binding protein
MRNRHHPLVRILLLICGILLLIAAPVASPLPGPGGTFLAAAGVILILRNSVWARHRFVRMKARWPRIGDLIDRILIRASAKRRRQRAKKLAAN